jgi:hypothetical protein
VGRTWKIIALAGLALAIGLVVLWRETDEPAIVPNDAGVSVSASVSVSGNAGPRSLTPTLALTPTPDRSATSSVRDPVEAIDPCEPLPRIEIPPGFDTTVVDGMTIAVQHDDVLGPADVPLSPTMLARVVEGSLADAAEETGTVPRAQLVVFVHASLHDLHGVGGVPGWAAGAYDGAVHVARAPHSELGVRVSTLRHEVMHAQLHAAVGCIPAWFNEGIASYFSSELSLRELFALLRDRASPDLRVLESPTLATLDEAATGRTYWQAVAMVVYAIEHSDGASLPGLVHRMSVLGRDEAMRLASWQRWFPDVDVRGALDAFGRHLFGGPPNFDATVCCNGVRDFATLACHAVTAHETASASHCVPP